MANNRAREIAHRAGRLLTLSAAELVAPGLTSRPKALEALEQLGDQVGEALLGVRVTVPPWLARAAARARKAKEPLASPRGPSRSARRTNPPARAGDGSRAKRRRLALPPST